jgi:hypothetical protein
MHIYLETAPNSGVLKYRGETGEHDNPESYAEKMAAHGLRVKISEENLGATISMPVADFEPATVSGGE